MTKQHIGVLVVSLVILINVLFYILFYPDMLSVEQGKKADRWLPEDNSQPSPPDISQLLDAGFWGDVVNKNEQAQSVEGEVKSEAQVLRQRIRAIVGGAEGRQVLFEVGKEYQRFKKGDVLPGTKWVLLDVHADRLELGKEGQNPRQLNIYSEDSLVEIDQELTEPN